VGFKILFLVTSGTHVVNALVYANYF